MITIKQLLLTGAALFIFNTLLTAQDGKKLREPHPLINNIYADRCHSCDSLADAYLFAGDTSMAIYYYQKYIDAHMDDFEKKNTTIKLRRLYYNKRQSFYLTDY